MSHGCSATTSSKPTVLQLQNCVGRMSCLLLEEGLSRHGQQIEMTTVVKIPDWDAHPFETRVD